MKKIIILLLISICVLLNSVLIVDAREVFNMGNAESLPGSTTRCGKDGVSQSCIMGYGVRLTLWYYDGVNPQREVGTQQVLIRNSWFFDEVKRYDESFYPNIPCGTKNGHPVKCFDAIFYPTAKIKYGAGWNNKKPKEYIDNSLPNPKLGTVNAYLEDAVKGVFAKRNSSYKSSGIAADITSVNSNFSPSPAMTVNNMKYFYLVAEPVFRGLPGHIGETWNSAAAAVNRTMNFETEVKKWVVDKEERCPSGYTKYQGRCRRYDAVLEEYNYTALLPAEGHEEIDYYSVARRYTVESYIYTVREHCSSLYFKGLYNSFGSDYNKHCALDPESDYCIEGKYEWYIGPDPKKALVGTKNTGGFDLVVSNTQQLEQNYTCSNTKLWKGNDGTKPDAMGIAFYYLPDKIGCGVVCEGKSGDSLLQCGENFCDEYTDYYPNNPLASQKEKKQCLLARCNYTFEQVDCVTSDPNDPAKGKGPDTNNLSANTNCSTNPNTDKNIVEQNSMLNVCSSSDRSDGRSVLDQKQYYSISCLESTRAKFLDTSTRTLVAGEALEYFVNLYGNKTCTAFFDINTWKFDYASIHSKDTDKRRENLIKILSTWNNATNSDKVLATSWDSLLYNVNEPVVNTTVTEIVGNKANQKEVNSRLYTLPRTYTNASSSIKAVKDNTTAIIAGNKSTTIKVNYYIQESKADLEYTIPAHCLTRDGLSTPYEATNGECKTGDGNARTVYYTNMYAVKTADITGGKNHHVTTNVTVNQEALTKININESCIYKIDDNDKIDCAIGVVEGVNDGSGTATYVSDVKLRISIIDNLSDSDSIKSFGIDTIKDTLNDEYYKTVGINSPTCGEVQRKVTIYGTVTTEQGKKATCEKTITLIRNDNQFITELPNGSGTIKDNPNLGCRVVQKEDTTFEVQVTKGSPKAVFTWLSGEEPRRITRDAVKNQYLVRTAKIDGKYVVYGGVTDGCDTAICYFKGCNGDNCNKPPVRCTDNCKPTEYDKIKAYCAENWQQDESSYDSYNDCVVNCGYGPASQNCRSIGCDPVTIEQKCDVSFSEWGYTDKYNCITDCNRWNVCQGRGIDYIYRPILLKNPFPDSYVDTINGYNGRIIGGNWIGKDKYITDDNNDSTNVTGPGSADSLPEYEIRLTQSMIKQIRNSNAAYNATSTKENVKNVYLDWVYYNDNKSGTYVSKFVNDEIKGYFSYIDGQPVNSTK